MSKFSLDVSAWVAKAKAAPETVVRAVAIKLFSAIITGSPVDTGRFRANWQAAGANPASGVKTDTDPRGSKSTSDMTNFVASSSEWSEFTLTNNLPYAQRLEYGWSKQAPVGMVRLNAARFQQLINEEAAKVK